MKCSKLHKMQAKLHAIELPYTYGFACRKYMHWASKQTNPFVIKAAFHHCTLSDQNHFSPLYTEWAMPLIAIGPDVFKATFSPLEDPLLGFGSCASFMSNDVGVWKICLMLEFGRLPKGPNCLTLITKGLIFLVSKEFKTVYQSIDFFFLRTYCVFSSKCTT